MQYHRIFTSLMPRQPIDISFSELRKFSDAIKNNPRTSKSTNKEITKALQDFLRYAVKRLERHNKRMDE